MWYKWHHICTAILLCFGLHIFFIDNQQCYCSACSCPWAQQIIDIAQCQVTHFAQLLHQFLHHHGQIDMWQKDKVKKSVTVHSLTISIVLVCRFIAVGGELVTEHFQLSMLLVLTTDPTCRHITHTTTITKSLIPQKVLDKQFYEWITEL